MSLYTRYLLNTLAENNTTPSDRPAPTHGCRPHLWETLRLHRSVLSNSHNALLMGLQAEVKQEAAEILFGPMSGSIDATSPQDTALFRVKAELSEIIHRVRVVLIFSVMF